MPNAVDPHSPEPELPHETQAGKKSVAWAVIAIVLGLAALMMSTCSLLFLGNSPGLAVIAVPCLLVGGFLGWLAWRLWKKSRGR